MGSKHQYLSQLFLFLGGKKLPQGGFSSTKCKFQSGVGGFRAADSRMNVTSYRTLTLTEIRSATYTNRQTV